MSKAVRFESCGGIDVLDATGPQGIQVFLDSDGESATEAFVDFIGRLCQ